MQISDLLRGLSVFERKQLVERVGAPDNVAKNPHTLGAFISDPNRLDAMFLSLDATELTLLRWVAMQPDHAAPWETLLAEVDGRIPVDHLTHALQELRVAGLADCKAAPRSGFVATYPAVAKVLFKQEVVLYEQLAQQDAEELRRACIALGAAQPPTTKAARIELIGRLLSRGDSLPQILSQLTDADRQLFDWVRARGGTVPFDQMARRYPGAPSASLRELRHIRHQRVAGPLAELVRRFLLIPLPDYMRWNVSAFAIAAEVERALATTDFFDDYPLRPPLLQPADAKPGSTPQPMHLLRDVAHLVGFLGAGRVEWKQDGQPYQRSLQAVGKALKNKDRDYPTFLWQLCTTAGVIRPLHPGNQPIDADALGPRGFFWLLVDAWIGSAGAAHHVNPVSLARKALLQVLASIPADTWIARDSLQAYLHFVRPLLFAPPAARGAARTPEPDWATVSRLFVAEGAAAGGQPAVMVPAAMQSLLADRRHGGADLLPPWETAWHVQPDRSIIAPPNLHPYGISNLWEVAQLEENHGASVFRITAATIGAALNRELEPAQIRGLLEAGAKAPLPDTVVRLLEDQCARYGQITLSHTQTLVSVTDPAILDTLLHDRKLSGLSIRRVAPDLACIDTVDPRSAREALRVAGYLPVLGTPSNGTGGSTGASQSARVSPQVVRFMKQRIEDGLLISVTWEQEGRTQSAVVEVNDIVAGRLETTRQPSGKDLTFDMRAILKAQVLADQTADDDSDDEYDFS